MALGFTWMLWWPAALVGSGLIALLVPNGVLMVVGTFGRMFAAVTLVAREGGRAGVRALFGRALRWRVAPICWAVVLAGPLLA